MTAPKRMRPPGGAAPEKALASVDSGTDYTTTDHAIDIVLARLDGVRKHGDAYRADCPVGHRSPGALSVAEGDDGRVLVTCFAGCSFPEVARAAGLSPFDFFARAAGAMTPAEKRAVSRRRREADWAAALRVLAHEAIVMLALAADMDRAPLNRSGRERLRLAVSRITGAQGVLS